MSKRQIVERSGILLQVDYELPCGEVTVQFKDIRVLGADYRPVGPNLVPLLDPMLVLCEPCEDAQPGESPLAERLLSTFLGEMT